MGALKFVHDTALGWLAPCARSPRGHHAPCTWPCPARSPRASTLGRSSPPGLGRGWPQRAVGPALAALPRATAIGATTSALRCRRLTVASAPPYGSAPLSALLVALPLLCARLVYPRHRHMAVPTMASPIKARQSLMPCRSWMRARLVRSTCVCVS